MSTTRNHDAVRAVLLKAEEFNGEIGLPKIYFANLVCASPNEMESILNAMSEICLINWSLHNGYVVLVKVKPFGAFVLNAIRELRIWEAAKARAGAEASFLSCFEQANLVISTEAMQVVPAP